MTPPTPHIMMMKGCWLRWNEDSTMVWPIGKIGAPNAPCTTRSASSAFERIDQAAQHRGGGEAGDRADHQGAPAELGGQPAGERRGDRGRDEVEGEDPGDLLLRRRERALELRQDHSDAGRGQAEQDGRELHRQQDQPLPAGEGPHPAMLRRPLRRASCLRLDETAICRAVCSDAELRSRRQKHLTLRSARLTRVRSCGLSCRAAQQLIRHGNVFIISRDRGRPQRLPAVHRARPGCSRPIRPSKVVGPLGPARRGGERAGDPRRCVPSCHRCGVEQAGGADRQGRGVACHIDRSTAYPAGLTLNAAGHAKVVKPLRIRQGRGWGGRNARPPSQRSRGRRPRPRPKILCKKSQQIICVLLISY